MNLGEIVPAIFLILLLILVLPMFVSTNLKSKQFAKNIFIWSVIVTSVVVVSSLILK